MVNADLAVQTKMVQNSRQMLIGKLVKAEQIQGKLLQVLKLIGHQKPLEMNLVLVEILLARNI